MKLLEEDEDKTMHSGADIDAFQAALNRDIGGDAPCSLPLDSGNVEILSHESNQASNQSLMDWQATGQDSSKTDLQNVQNPLLPEQHCPAMELKDHGSATQVVEQHNDASCELTHLSEPQTKSLNGFSQAQLNHSSLHVSETSGMQIPEESVVPISGIDKMQSSSSDPKILNPHKSAQRGTTSAEQSVSSKNQGTQISFATLLLALRPHLVKDKYSQLQNLFNQLRRNDIAKNQFVRLMRNLVGERVVKLVVAQLELQLGSNRPQSQPLALARQQNVRMPVGASMSQFTDSRSVPHSAVPGKTTLNPPPLIANPQTAIELDCPTDMHGKPVTQMSSSNAITPKQERDHHYNPMPVQNKQQQMDFQYPETSFSMNGSTSGNYHLSSGTNVSSSTSSMKPQSHDLPIRPMSHHQTIGVTQSVGATETMNNMVKRQHIVSDPARVQNGSAYYAAKPSGQPNSVPWQAPTNKDQSSAAFSSVNHVKQEVVEQHTEQKKKTQMPSPQGLVAPSVEQGNSYSGHFKEHVSVKQSSKISISTSSMMPANSVSPSAPSLDANVQSQDSRIPPSSGGTGKTPPKKPTIGQKKPLDSLCSPPPSSKKQKVSGTFLDQSIEQLNDVTAVSGVNLVEEEEQLFSVPKEDSRASEASRKVVQEEEEKLILEKVPLQKKLAGIMAKFGLKSTSNDVERCLSQCVEERLRGLLCNMIRLSKQRVDTEKARHRTLITSDVRQQIMMMNQKAKEEWDRKQAEEAEKLRKVNEPDSENKAEGDKDKDEGRSRSTKANKEEDDKMRTNAANVAARKAAGVDDMLSKWQLMAQARQKREGGSDVTYGSQLVKDANRTALSITGRSNKENSEAERRSSRTASGANRKFGRNQVFSPQRKVNRIISVKDVIAALEREPQMSKSTLMYRLYERIQSDTPSE